MQSRMFVTAVAGTLLAASALAQPAVTLTLESSKQGWIVPPGATIDWTIKASVSTGDNAGLALVLCDLVQDGSNPTFFDLPPANLSSVDATMADFSRPLGVSNPGENGAATGYVGVQRGEAGRMNLVQIGGGQNTFGVVAAPGIGENVSVQAGVGQSGPQVVAAGSFPAPETPGTYLFRLENAIGNVLTTVRTAPAFSPAASAAVNSTGAILKFTVLPRQTGDANCDGAVDFDDINPFVLALISYEGYHARYPDCGWYNADCDGDGTVDFDDINPFVKLLVGGG